MSINRKRLGALLCVVAAGVAVVASTAGAARQSTPGVTSNSVTIGGTFPLTGPANLYATIPAAEEAYFAYVNAHGGVNGRSINDIVEDDGYNPSTTITDDQDLVENKNVFAIVGSLGTEPGKQTMAYLNQHKVPQVLLATGDAYWGECSAKPFHPVKNVCPTSKPWTMGWQPDYPGEGRLYAKYILAHQSNPKIGILRQDDDYGANYLAGFQQGLGKKNQSDIVDVEQYNALTETSSDIGTAIYKLMQAGANTIVLFSTPKPSIQALVAQHTLGFSGHIYLNNVSANRIFMLNAEQACSCALPGVVSSTYVKSSTVTPNDSSMQLAQQIIHQYNPAAFGGPGALDQEFAIGDSNLVYGLGVAYTFVDALKHAGKNPTRKSFMKAIRSLSEGNGKNPFLWPGIHVHTTAKQTFPMTQLQLTQWNAGAHPSAPYGAGDWDTLGNVVNSGH